ncbi:MAG: 5'/3'-nucleotidase SurE [Clostridia bacterium]|nr:5'/3'-nucleotidase SurE [Clostridia bacterium]
MRILITNDDSISAEQLLPLVKYCRKFGEVTVAVPEVEQSAKSHGIELHKAFRVEKRFLDGDVVTYVVDSTPADCMRYVILGLEQRFDLVISGVNRGLNMGSDILYSGTVSAVREAVLQGIPAIALSTTPENYQNATAHLDLVFDYINEHKLLEIHNAYNINIPPNPKGIKITRQGGMYFSDGFINVEGDLYRADGKCVYKPSNDLTLDTDATISGYISIMPLSMNVTDMDVFKCLTNK